MVEQNKHVAPLAEEAQRMLQKLIDNGLVLASKQAARASMLASAPQPDIEEMVEGVAKVMSVWDGGSIPYDDRSPEDRQHGHECARAVLRHLFGDHP